MSFDEHDKMYNWPTSRRPPHKMSHGDINMLPYHAFDDTSSKVALTDHEWKTIKFSNSFAPFLGKLIDITGTAKLYSFLLWKLLN